MERNTPAKKEGKLGWLVLAALLLLCLAAGVLFYRPRGGETLAVITVDGRELRRIQLEEARDGSFSILEETGKPVSFEIKDHAIRFINVTCPDHICERAGWCRSPGERAVCLPNRTALVCYSAAELSP